MSIEFTQEQVDELYQMIISTDSAFMKKFVKAAVVSAADVQASMWNDGEVGVPLFDTEDVRSFAADFTSDMIDGFKITFLEEIKRTKMEVDLQVQTTVKID